MTNILDRITFSDNIDDAITFYNLIHHLVNSKADLIGKDLILVMKHKNKLVGALTYTARDNVIYFYNLDIKRNFRKRGLGKYLLSELAEKATREKRYIKATKIELKNVEFYKRCGFTIKGGPERFTVVKKYQEWADNSVFETKRHARESNSPN